MKNLSFSGVTLFAGLVLSFAACKKANVLQEKQVQPKNAVEVPSQTELARGEKNIQAVFDKLKRIPTRELVEFSDGSDKKFLNPYILAFDLVYDAQKKTYSAKNVRKLWFYYSLIDDRTIYNPKDRKRRFDYLVHAARRHNLSEYDFSFPSAQIAERIAHEHLANVADINSEDDFNKTANGTVYVVKCKGGGLNGNEVATYNPLDMARAVDECVKAGGCAETCGYPSYVIPGHVLAEYGDFTKDKQVLNTILQGVEDAYREEVAKDDKDDKEVKLENPSQQRAHDIDVRYTAYDVLGGKFKKIDFSNKAQSDEFYELTTKLKKSLKSSWHY